MVLSKDLMHLNIGALVVTRHWGGVQLISDMV